MTDSTEQPATDSMDDGSGSSCGRLSRSSAWIRRAQQGDAQALNPVIERMSPLLLAVARRCLGPCVDRVDPEDLVQEAWAVAMRRIGDLKAADGHLGRVLRAFLIKTIYRSANRALRRSVEAAARVDPNALEGRPGAILAAESSDVLKRVMKSEMCRDVLGTLEDLDPLDRDLFYHRGLEGLPYGLIARMIGKSENSLAKQFERVCRKLKASLGAEFLDDFMG